MKKKRLAWLPNLLVLGLLAYLVVQRLPAVRNNFAREGTPLPRISLETLNDVRVRLPDPALGRTVLFFWATWCGPCRFEMSRFKDAVLEGELDGAKFFAVNIAEQRGVVEAHVSEHKYPFPVLLDGAGLLSGALEVSGTPTIVHLESDGTVASMNTGIQPFSVTRAARFLAGK